MTEAVKNAVVKTLDDLFGYPIYLEKVRQNFETPSFFVEGGSFSERHLIGNRFVRTFPIKVTYYPSKEDIPNLKNYEMDRVMEKLFLSLTRIQSDGEVFGGSLLTATKSGDTLSFSVEYKTVVNKVPEEDGEIMQRIEYIKRSE